MTNNSQKSLYKVRFYYENMSENEINEIIKKFKIPVTTITHDDPNWENKIKAITETE